MISHLLLMIVVTLLSDVESQCHFPPPSTNFTLKGYYGLWYEIGKQQTPGGAFFEKDCVCTNIYVQPNSGSSKVGDSTVLNSCRKSSPTGHYLNATGQLIDMVQPGKWKEKFFALAPAVDYTVIYMDEDFAVEYDCGETFGSTNYCIHLLARVPNPDPKKVEPYLAWIVRQGLNSQQEPYVATLQKSCW